MQAMIQNDQEKEWMLPLLELRNELDADDRAVRDFRRMNGSVQLFKDRVIPGPYTQAAREQWLRKVLEAQRHIRSHGPELVRDIELIALPELAEIRRLWVLEKHEIEDSLPRIYESVLGAPYPGGRVDDNLVLGAEEMAILREICGSDDLHFQLTRELLDIERQHRSMARRAGLFKALEQSLRRGFFENAEDAEQRALSRRSVLDDIRGAVAETELPLVQPAQPASEPTRGRRVTR
jgi:DNA sulfur modification protein DndC